MQFSKEQQAAITADNRELLVSAAAGSGKTAVLIEKIYTMLKSGMQIERMLVVTFTRAAAAEMRERLKQRMTEDSAAHIRLQRERLELAHISTLHSFCHTLVQEYFQVVDIDPLSGIADNTTSANLFQEALDEAMDSLYDRAAQGDASAAALTAKFLDKQIVSMAQTLYPFLMTLAEPFVWLKQHASKEYTLSDLDSGPMAETLLADCRVLLDGASELADSLADLAEHPDCHEKYVASIHADMEAVSAVLSRLPDGLRAIVHAASDFSLDRMPSLRNLSDDEKSINLEYKKIRDGIKKMIKKVSDQFTQPPDQIIRRLNTMQPALMGLHDLCEAVHQGFLERKKQRCLLDPNDLEHMALSILSHSEIRAAVSARFDAVFVDEYQDISGVQEALLNAVKANADAASASASSADLTSDVSRETSTNFSMDSHPLADASLLSELNSVSDRQTIHNTTQGISSLQRFFYVGDVKQSIYRFRQADPTLFMAKEQTFSSSPSAPHRRIDLNRNYRSRGAVLSAVNRVFSRVMRPDVTEIVYDKQAMLYPGQVTEKDPPVQVHLFPPSLRAAEKIRVQAAAIAQLIRQKVGQPFLDRKENKERTLRYRDIAILAPKMKGVDDVLSRALSALDIPVYAEGSGAGLQSDEIAQVLCHLRLMDNIADDLSLLACLRSPAISITDAELAEIRIRSPKGSYLHALRCAADGKDALAFRCREALDNLEHERFLMMNMPLSEYLWSWLSRSGLYAFYGCQPFGTLRQANLRLLCQRAVEFQDRGGGVLHEFLESVTAVTTAKESISPTVLSPKEDVVRVMSIHKSKGLEFPVVILMGLELPFSKSGAAPLKLHQKLGAALPYIDEVRRIKGATLLENAIRLRLESENRAERARVLYVGMTRARDELILSGCGDWEGFCDAPPSAYAVADAGNMMDWLMRCTDSSLDAHETANDEFSTLSTGFPWKTCGFRIVSHISTAEIDELLQLTTTSSDRASLESRRARLQGITEEARVLAKRLSIDPQDLSDPLAPRLNLHHHPFKVGVTALVRARHASAAETPPLYDPDSDDPSAAETVQTKRLPLPLTRPRQIADLPSLPSFLQERGAMPRGLIRGVATHKALSLLRYAPLKELPAEAEQRIEIREQLQSFLRQSLLTEEEFHSIDVTSLSGFFQSQWGMAALRAETVHREWSFVLRLPEEDGLLVQGVIDLCYLKDGQWELIDYKTDRIDHADGLWSLYGDQIALYQRALSEITGLPVRSATLYALSLGSGSSRSLS